MQTQIIDRIDEIPASEWNRVAHSSQPFVRHEFLAALERQGCVGERYGWLPRHILARDDSGRLVGATPLYLKFNSYGELVFDWAWADAYQRQGLDYYPKLVSAVPYTPATGGRLLTAPDADAGAVRRLLADTAVDFAASRSLSSLHWLFPSHEEAEMLQRHGLMLRVGCQFHWHNRGYGSFDDFLGALTARTRKTLRRERARVLEAGIRHDIRLGGEVSDREWTQWQRLYESTFERKSGIPTLSEGFFREIGRTLPEQVVLIFARRHGEVIAGALCLRSDDTLYGRHWGCFERHDALHFETCYYQGIEYCIGQGLTRFEPGAQGEHKVARGFLPARTWSAHWIAHPGFRQAIARFLDQETAAMEDYMRNIETQGPYRNDPDAVPA